MKKRLMHFIFPRIYIETTEQYSWYRQTFIKQLQASIKHSLCHISDNIWGGGGLGWIYACLFLWLGIKFHHRVILGQAYL